jgi:hypothetical protein
VVMRHLRNHSLQAHIQQTPLQATAPVVKRTQHSLLIGIWPSAMAITNTTKRSSSCTVH